MRRKGFMVGRHSTRHAAPKGSIRATLTLAFSAFFVATGAMAQPPTVEVTAATLLELRDRIAADTPAVHTIIELTGDVYPGPGDVYPFGHTVVDISDKHYLTIRGNGRRIVAVSGSIGGRSGVSVGIGSTYITIENVVLEYQLTADDPVPGGPGLPPNHIHYGSAASGVYICGSACGGTEVTANVAVTDSLIVGFPGAGVGTNRADYVVVRNNVIWNNGFLQQDGHSGVSLFRHERRNDGGGSPLGLYDNEVVGNRIFSNANLVGIETPPYFDGVPLFEPYARTTDGNGVIVDQFIETGYDGTTLVANNELFDNGAVGIHLFGSTNVDVLNNTLFENGWRWAGDIPGYTAPIDLVYWSTEGQHDPSLRAEIDARRAQHAADAFDGSEIRIWNNLIFPRDDLFDAASPPVVAGCEESWVTCDANVENLTADATVETPARDDTADFRLIPGSPAIDTGIDTTAPENGGLTSDIGGGPRKIGAAVDIGAWELDGDDALPAPIDLQVVAATSSTLEITWTTVVPVSGFEVWVDGQWHAWTVDETYTVDGLESATEYWLEVYAILGADRSPPAGIVGTTTGDVPAPTALAIVQLSSKSASFEWETSETVDGFEIWLDGQWIAWTAQMSYAISDLTPGASYIVEVLATRGTEKSPRSALAFPTPISPNVGISRP